MVPNAAILRFGNTAFDARETAHPHRHAAGKAAASNALRHAAAEMSAQTLR